MLTWDVLRQRNLAEELAHLKDHVQIAVVLLQHSSRRKNDTENGAFHRSENRMNLPRQARDKHSESEENSKGA